MELGLLEDRAKQINPIGADSLGLCDQRYLQIPARRVDNTGMRAESNTKTEHYAECDHRAGRCH
jgi:hypothetical protein